MNYQADVNVLSSPILKIEKNIIEMDDAIIQIKNCLLYTSFLDKGIFRRYSREKHENDTRIYTKPISRR